MRHFVPLVFVVYLVSLVMGGMALLNNSMPGELLTIFALPLVAYLVLVSLASFHAGKTGDSPCGFWRILISFLILHVSYGLGGLSAIANVGVRKMTRLAAKLR